MWSRFKTRRERSELEDSAATANVDATLRQRQPGVRQIQCNTGGVVDGEADRLRGRAAGRQYELQTLSSGGLHIDRLQLVGRRLRRQYGLAGQCDQREQQQAAQR